MNHSTLQGVVQDKRYFHLLCLLRNLKKPGIISEQNPIVCSAAKVSAMFPVISNMPLYTFLCMTLFIVFIFVSVVSKVDRRMRWSSTILHSSDHLEKPESKSGPVPANKRLFQGCVELLQNIFPRYMKSNRNIFPDYASLSGIPLPKAYLGFNITRALPRPYRPFRWVYHQTMCMYYHQSIFHNPKSIPQCKHLSTGHHSYCFQAFKKMEPDWWLELENTYILRISQRKELFEKHGKNVLDCLPGAEASCRELMEMALQFLVARYPHCFSLKYKPQSVTQPTGIVFINRILNKEFHLDGIDPLLVLLENVPEDFAIMIPNSNTGDYELRAGVICSSLGWTLGTKIGMNLQGIHQPIPDYKEKLSLSMDR
jgi:hypothetical protein